MVHEWERKALASSDEAVYDIIDNVLKRIAGIRRNIPIPERKREKYDIRDSCL